MESTPDLTKYPYANPTMEFLKLRGLNKPQDIECLEAKPGDILLALLCSADAIWFELRKIRTAVENR
jgi:hypothetical protein